jgi:solute carrier family 25 uncoupling protein 8/9
VADTIFNPLEVLKVRRQVAMGSVSGSAPVPASTLALARAAIRERGVWRGLWHPGLEATVYRAFTYTGFRIGSYPAVRDAIVNTGAFGGGDAVAARVAAGAATGGHRLGAVQPYRRRADTHAGPSPVRIHPRRVRDDREARGRRGAVARVGRLRGSRRDALRRAARDVRHREAAFAE